MTNALTIGMLILGYWIGQSYHGIKPLILAILLWYLDVYLVKVGLTIFRSWFYNYDIKNQTWDIFGDEKKIK